MALVVLASVAGGCVRYESKPLAPQRSADAFGARRLDSPEIRDEISRLMPGSVNPWPPPAWDRGQLLAVALADNPELAVARGEVQSALSREMTAAQMPNPDLTLESEYARHDPHPWLYGIGLNWLLRGAERRDLGIEMARLDTSSARLQLLEQAWRVRSELAGALSDWIGARRGLTLLNRLAAAEDRLLAGEELRVQAGEDAAADLVVTRQSRIQIVQEQAHWQAAADGAQAAVARSLGVPPRALDSLVVAWPDWGEPPQLAEATLRNAREQALLSRADLAAAIDGYTTAEAKLRLAVARQYPQLTLSPGYYWDHGIAKFPLDVGFTLPLNRNKGEIAEARAGRELAAQRMFALQSDIYGEVEAAEHAEDMARRSLAVAQRQAASALVQRQFVDIGLKVGAADTLEQMRSQILVTRAEFELLQMHAQLQSSRNKLEDALHAPLSGPELALATSSISAPALGSPP
jgi:outer membrane protein TolC